MLGRGGHGTKGEGSGRMPGSGANSGHCITHPAHIRSSLMAIVFAVRGDYISSINCSRPVAW